jgi:hypothetical protein
MCQCYRPPAESSFDSSLTKSFRSFEMDSALSRLDAALYRLASPSSGNTGVGPPEKDARWRDVDSARTLARGELAEPPSWLAGRELASPATG